jgi:nickel-dependent lactate racemase
MLNTQLIAPPGQHLANNEITNLLARALEKQFTNQRVMVLIPDHTRSLPLVFLFHTLTDILSDAAKLDFMVALGTHPPLSEDNLNRLVGITGEERVTRYSHIDLINHAWNDPSCLVTIGVFEQDQIKSFAGDKWHPSLPARVDIRLNKAALEYDHIIILGPTFPHEVVGFSGGVKYIFPGISGAEMINATHWLGALGGVVGTIGYKNTPARAMVNAAAEKLATPLTLIALVVEDHELSGLFIGDSHSAWDAAVDLSTQRHIRWYDKPFQRVLSCAPAMYDELWTCAKAMYKLEPVAALNGEVVIYAPHLDTISHAHGKYIREIGYHILPYFLANWERFKHIPLGVLAHSTHLRGSGVMENGVEMPNVRVTLSSRIPAEECERLNLGYLDPASISIAKWQGREQAGILYVPQAGEILYRCK